MAPRIERDKGEDLLDLQKVDLGDLAEPLEDHSYDHSWWLDSETGEVVLWSDHFDEQGEPDPESRGLRQSTRSRRTRVTRRCRRSSSVFEIRALATFWSGRSQVGVRFAASRTRFSTSLTCVTRGSASTMPVSSDARFAGCSTSASSMMHPPRARLPSGPNPSLPCS